LEPYEDEIEGKLIHELGPGISYIEYNDSSVTFEHKIFNSDESDPGSYTPIKKEGRFTLGTEKTIYSYSYEQNASGLNLGDDEGSVMVKVNFNTSNSNISPVVDITKSQMIGYENIIRSMRKQLTGLSTFYTSGTTVTGSTSGSGETVYLNEVIPGAVLRNSEGKVIGIVKDLTTRASMTLEENAAIEGVSDLITVDYEATDVLGNSKYHTKHVQLPSSQEADDLVVFLDAAIPAGTDVRVYAKFLAPGDTTTYDKRPWTLMTKSDFTNSLGAGEFLYKLNKNNHDENTKVGGLNSSSVFQYTTNGVSYTQFKSFAVKIVLLSVDSYYKPEVYSMRALAVMA
jgi:hypothetical protein